MGLQHLSFGFTLLGRRHPSLPNPTVDLADPRTLLFSLLHASTGFYERIDTPCRNQINLRTLPYREGNRLQSQHPECPIDLVSLLFIACP